MVNVPRITPEDARRKVSNGSALLVCAYEDPASFQSMRLEGAIPIQEFRDKLSSIGKEKEIVFYCA